MTSSLPCHPNDCERHAHPPGEPPRTERMPIDAPPGQSTLLHTDQQARLFPPVGSTLLGFHLLKILGEGGFARVFLAHQEELAGRLVVLKCSLRPTDEPRMLARLQHAHIVPIYSLHSLGDLEVQCMPYLGGTTLAEVLAGLRGLRVPKRSGRDIVSTLVHTRGGGVPVVPLARLEPRAVASEPDLLGRLETMPFGEAVVWLMTQLAEGLAHAHERGVLHRDIKPANVLLTDDGQAMLLDFNLARDAADPRRSRAGGTVLYMSPEQLSAFVGEPATVGPASDIYSLGLVFYELLASRHPYEPPADGTDPVTFYRRMLLDRRAPPPPLGGLPPTVGPAVASVVLKCLRPDPAERYASARDLVEDLRRHADGLPLKFAPNTSPRERFAKWRRRHPRLTSGAAVATAALLLLAGLGGLLAERSLRLAVAEARRSRDELLADKRALAPFLGAAAADPARLAGALAAGRAALVKRGAVGDPADWPILRDLPAGESDALRREAGEWLFLMARAAAAMPVTAGDAAGLADAARAALGLEVSPWVHNRLAELRAPDVPLAPAGPPPAGPWEEFLAAADLAIGGRPALALPLVRRVLDADPGSFPARFLLGVCLMHADRLEAAQAAFDACLILEPGHDGARLNRGICRSRLCDFEGALADLDALVARRPDLPDARFERAAAREGAGDAEGARADLDVLVADPAAPVRYLLRRARIRDGVGDRDGAEADRQAALAREPDDELSWVVRGLARAEADPEGALRDFTEALRLNPRSRPALHNAASVLAEQLGRTADAVALLDRLLETDPGLVPARSGRAVLLARLGRRGAAHADARRAVAEEGTAETLHHAATAFALTSRTHPGDRREAMRLLTLSLVKGYPAGGVAGDADWAAFRGDAEFLRVLKSFGIR